MMKRGRFLNVNSEVLVQKLQTGAISDQDLHCSHLKEALHNFKSLKSYANSLHVI